MLLEVKFMIGGTLGAVVCVGMAVTRGDLIWYWAAVNCVFGMLPAVMVYGLGRSVEFD